MRTGDVVFNRPTGEEWLVAYVEDGEEPCRECGGNGTGPDRVDGPGEVYQDKCEHCGGAGRVDGKYLAPCGWPFCLSRVEDNELRKSASDEESHNLLVELADMNARNDMRKAYARRKLGRDA